MPPRKQWVFDPDSGGRKIPESVKYNVERRIQDIAEKHFKGKYTRLDIRFRDQFCIAKTQSSLSDNPKLPGAPKGWTLTVTDAHLAAGAGFIVVVAGNMLLMPGLSKTPQAIKMDVDEDGNIIGLR